MGAGRAWGNLCHSRPSPRSLGTFPPHGSAPRGSQGGSEPPPPHHICVPRGLPDQVIPPGPKMTLGTGQGSPPKVTQRIPSTPNPVGIGNTRGRLPFPPNPPRGSRTWGVDKVAPGESQEWGSSPCLGAATQIPTGVEGPPKISHREGLDPSPSTHRAGAGLGHSQILI